MRSEAVPLPDKLVPPQLSYHIPVLCVSMNELEAAQLIPNRRSWVNSKHRSKESPNTGRLDTQTKRQPVNSSRCRNPSSKNQDNMSPLQMANPIVMVPSESNLGELPDKVVQRIINMFKEFKEDVNKLQN